VGLRRRYRRNQSRASLALFSNALFPELLAGAVVRSNPGLSREEKASSRNSETDCDGVACGKERRRVNSPENGPARSGLPPLDTTARTTFGRCAAAANAATKLYRIRNSLRQGSKQRLLGDPIRYGDDPAA
jgi:hypothetical protein